MKSPPVEKVEEVTGDAFSRSSFRHYFKILISQIVVIVGSIIVYKIAAHFLSREEFSKYLLSRRSIGILAPLLSLGIGVVLARRVAMEELLQRRTGMLVASIFAVFLAGLFSALLLWPASTFWANALFGDASMEDMILPCIIAGIGLGCTSICYNFLRGMMSFGYASILESISLGVLPVLAFLITTSSARLVLMTLGVALSSVSLLILFFTLSRLGLSLSPRAIFREGVELVSKGWSRIPSEMAWAALFGVPSMIVAHTSDIRNAGMIAFGCTVLTLSSTIYSPISVKFLPHVVRRVQHLEFHTLRKEIQYALSGCVLLSVVGTISSYCLMPTIIVLYLGSEYSDGSEYVQAMTLAMPACAVFVCLRSVIDAVYDRAWNSIILLVSLAVSVTVAMCAFKYAGSIYCAIIGFLCSVYTLAILSIILTYRFLSAMDLKVTREKGSV